MRRLSDNFWNIRGTQRIARLIDIGTHMSVLRRSDGRFVIIDGCGLDDAERSALLELTDGGMQVEAVVHVHPFHTLHVEATYRLFPSAELHGTSRHHRMFPGLPWARTAVEEWSSGHPFADLIDTSVPDGVDFVCPDERVHTASLLVRHRESGIVHVDDTLNVMPSRGFLGLVTPGASLRMHPLLGRALRPEAGAADAYATWATHLATRWADTPVVCAAHSAVRELPPGGFEAEVRGALASVERTLARHRARYG